MANGFRQTQLNKQVNHRLSDLIMGNLVQFRKYLLGAYYVPRGRRYKNGQIMDRAFK